MFSEQQNQDIYKRRSALPERVQAVVDQIRAGIGQGRPSLAEWLTLKTQTHMQTHIHTSSYLPYIYIYYCSYSPIAMLWGLAKLIGGRAPSGHRQSWWADGVPVMF